MLIQLSLDLHMCTCRDQITFSACVSERERERETHMYIHCTYMLNLVSLDQPSVCVCESERERNSEVHTLYLHVDPSVSRSARVHVDTRSPSVCV